MRKRTLATIITTLIVALLILSACGARSADFAAGFKSKDPTTFVMLEISGGVITLDPALAYDSASGEPLQNMYDTLVFYNREKKTELVPMLATEVPTIKNGGVSADGLTVTFKIRKGVQFHSGEEMTVDDVAYTFQRGILSGGSASPQWLFVEPLFGSTGNNDITDQLDPDGSKELIDNRDGLKAEDPAALKALCETVKSKIVADSAANTVTFHLAQPWGPFVITFANMWGSIQQKAWVVASGGWDGDCGTWQNWYSPTPEEVNAKALGSKANGTGPYKLKEWGDTEFIMEANENYWVEKPLWSGGPTGAPKIKTVILKWIEEFSTRYAAFQAGDGDSIQAGSAENWPVLDEQVGATCDRNGVCAIDDAAKPFVRYIKQDTANRTDALFNYKINTEGGNDFVGSGKLDGNGIPPDFFSDVHVRRAFAYCFDWDIFIRDVQQNEGTQANNVMLIGEIGDEPKGAHYSYDPKKCEEEFKASTWKSEDGRSLWDVGFRVAVGYNAGNQERQSVIQIFRDNISAVNPLFKLESASLEWPNYIEASRNRKLAFYIVGWIEDIPDPHNWTFTYTMGYVGSRQNLPKELKEQFRPLVEAGAKEIDPAKRAAIYKDFNKLYYDNMPAILLAQAGVRRYFQRWVNGYYTNALYSWFYYYPLSKS